MKTQTLLLGEYDSSVFSIYIKPEPDTSTTTIDYLSIEDLYRLFFHHSSNEISPLFFTLYQRHPHDFYRDHQNKCYIAKHHAMTIAKSLHLFALAEFCTLSHDELINRTADPLFAITNALMLRPVTPKRMIIDLDWFALSSSSLFFSNYLNTVARFLAANTRRYFPITTTCNKQNDHSWSRHFLPLPNTGTKQTILAQRQQQAIIECRQRLSVYRQSVSSAPQRLQSKKSAVLTKPKTSPSSSATHNGMLATLLSPSDHHPSNKTQQRKRKSASPPLNNDSYYCEKKLKKSSYSNLDLLATQATKMKGLPLSPEISPPPPLPPTTTILSLPPISSTKPTNASFHSSSPFIQTISLPSIRNVLSDI